MWIHRRQRLPSWLSVLASRSGVAMLLVIRASMSAVLSRNQIPYGDVLVCSTVLGVCFLGRNKCPSQCQIGIRVRKDRNGRPYVHNHSRCCAMATNNRLLFTSAAMGVTVAMLSSSIRSTAAGMVSSQLSGRNLNSFGFAGLPGARALALIALSA